MGKIIGYKHGENSIDKVDPRLWDIVQHAIAVSPYDAQIRSGSERTGGKGNHKHGYAIDVTFRDKSGNWIKDIGRDANSAKIYEQYAQAARVYQQSNYPELDKTFRWGGGFRQGNEFDFMHLDITPARGGAMAYYDWDKGFNSAAKAAIPGLDTSPGLGDPRVRRQLELAYENAGTLLPPANIPGVASETDLGAPTPMPSRPFGNQTPTPVMPMETPPAIAAGRPPVVSPPPASNPYLYSSTKPTQFADDEASQQRRQTPAVPPGNLADIMRERYGPTIYEAGGAGDASIYTPLGLPPAPVSPPSLNDTRREQNTTYRPAAPIVVATPPVITPPSLNDTRREQNTTYRPALPGGPPVPMPGRPAALNAAPPIPGQPPPMPMPGRPAGLNIAPPAIPIAAPEPPAAQATKLLRLPSGQMIAPGVYDNAKSGIPYTVTEGPNGTAVINSQRSGFVDLGREINAPTILGGIIRSKIPEVAQDAMNNFAPAMDNVKSTAANAINSAVPMVQGFGNTIGGMFGGLFGGQPSGPQYQPGMMGRGLPTPQAPSPLMPSPMLRAVPQVPARRQQTRAERFTNLDEWGNIR